MKLVTRRTAGNRRKPYILIHTSVKLVTKLELWRTPNARILIHTSVKLVTPHILRNV